MAYYLWNTIESFKLIRYILIWKNFVNAVLCMTEDVYIKAEVCVCVYIYMYIYMYIYSICTYTFINAQKKMSRRIYTKLSPVVTGKNENKTGEGLKGVFIFTWQIFILFESLFRLLFVHIKKTSVKKKWPLLLPASYFLFTCL